MVNSTLIYTANRYGQISPIGGSICSGSALPNVGDMLIFGKPGVAGTQNCYKTSNLSATLPEICVYWIKIHNFYLASNKIYNDWIVKLIKINNYSCLVILFNQ